MKSKEETVTRVSDIEALRHIWERVFVTKSPFGDPFRPELQSRILFCPTDLFVLTRAQYAAIIQSASVLGDSGFFASNIEYAGDFLGKGDSWYCRFPSYEEYLRIPLVIENALYSENAKWGVMVSSEFHAVVGGGRTFAEEVKKAYPSWREDLARLRDIWKGRANSDWAEGLIKQIGD